MAGPVERYFDHAATTPLDPQVFEAMRPYFGAAFGNSESLHAWGREAHDAVELARLQVAALLGGAPEEVFFTSGATEANNWLLRSFPARSVLVSPFEHSSVALTAAILGIGTLDNSGWILAPPPGSVQVVSVMTVNNETGAVLAVPPTPAKVHRDVTQSLGKLPLDLAEVHWASASAHKLYGPKSVGCLWIRDAEPLPPLLTGGGHERGQRAGTLNVPAIVGFGAACALASDRMDEDLAHAQILQETVLDGLSGLDGVGQNDHAQNSPYVLSVSFRGVEGEALVVELDALGYAVSSGAACSSGSAEPSRVLSALNIDEEWAKGTVRVSFGRANTRESAAGLAQSLARSVRALRG
jgi:cysteine desulfurase